MLLACTRRLNKMRKYQLGQKRANKTMTEKERANVRRELENRFVEILYASQI